MNGKRILILAGPGQSTNILYHALTEEFEVAAVVLEQPVPRSEFLRRRIKKLGLPRVIGQVAFATLVVPLLRASSRGRQRGLLAESGLRDSPIEPSRILHVPSVNSDETIEILRRENPDVVVVNGTRIISERILSSVPAKFVNMHAGITPRYRGVHGAYWALVERDLDHCGVTVHLVDRGIDTGTVLAQSVIRPTASDNFVTYPLLQLAAGIPLLKTVLIKLLAGDVEVKPYPEGPSRLWSHPRLGEYLRYRVLRGVR